MYYARVQHFNLDVNIIILHLEIYKALRRDRLNCCKVDAATRWASVLPNTDTLSVRCMTFFALTSVALCWSMPVLTSVYAAPTTPDYLFSSNQFSEETFFSPCTHEQFVLVTPQPSKLRHWH